MKDKYHEETQSAMDSTSDNLPNRALSDNANNGASEALSETADKSAGGSLNNNQVSPSIIATLFWAMVLYLVPNVVVGFGFNFYADIAGIKDTEYWFGQIETLLLMTFAVFFVMAPLLVSLTKALERHSSVVTALNVRLHSVVDIAKCVGLTALFWAVLSSLAIALDVPEEPFLEQIKFADLPLWFICLNICVLAPIFEELVFRGFLFKRFSATKLSALGAALLTSALFAVVHGQYSFIGVAMVFLLGLYFVWIRIKFNSTTQAMVAHATSNSMTMLAIYWY